MVLVLNCLLDEGLVRSFNRAVERQIYDNKMEAYFVRLQDLEAVPDMSTYSHIIISGCEASVTQNRHWDKLLTDVILHIVAIGKPLLAICYGHQFLAAALMGEKDAVRRSPTPEMGWVEICFSDNPLFAGIKSLVSMVSHYDEVWQVNDHFKVLAHSSRCAVHAFQYRDLPVWGVQFHPEYGHEEAEEIFAWVKSEDSRFGEYYANQLQDESQQIGNSIIFKNFLGMRG